METVAKRIMRLKDSVWPVLDSSDIGESISKKEFHELRLKWVLRKLPSVNVYVITLGNRDVSDELFVLMNKFQIIAYYARKTSSVLSPKTFYETVYSPESCLSFELLSTNGNEREANIGALSISVRKAPAIYGVVRSSGFVKNYPIAWTSAWLPWISESIYALFHSMDGSWITKWQLELLKNHSKLLDKRIRLDEIRPVEKPHLPQRNPFENYGDETERLITTYRSKLSRKSFPLPRFTDRNAYFDYIGQRKVDDIYNTTTIEGEEIWYDELVRFLEGRRDVFEKDPKKLQIVGYEKAFENVIAWKVPVSEDGVKEIHSSIFAPIFEKGFSSVRTGGSYSNSQRYIGHRTPKMVADGVLPTIPPSPAKVPYGMNVLDSFLKRQDVGNFEKAVVFHLVFIKIHPFSDGNGRTARLFFNNVLFRERLWWLVVPWEERDAYFDRIDHAIRTEDPLPFAKYVSEKLVEERKTKIFRP